MCHKVSLFLVGSIRENITFVNPDISENDLRQALQVSGCDEFVNKLQNGIETILGEKGKGLSEGQLQRIALARAIASGAPILIFDEITSSLDRKTEEKILENIKKMKNKTIIIVTHRESVSKICNREYVIENKEIKEKKV